MQEEKWLAPYKDGLKGKTVVLFGATGGIGAELCRYILKLGGGLITVDRNREKALALKSRLQIDFPSAKIINLTADLEDIYSVEAICRDLEKQDFDLLIHGAGAYSIPRRKCATGLDNVFQINFLSPYYITKRLLPTLKERGGRVVAVGSIAHNYSKTDLSDIDFSSRKASSLVYGNAKRYLMFSLYELMRENGEDLLAVTHPGITLTGITNHYPKWLYTTIKHPMKIIFMKPRKASLSIVKGFFSPTPDGFWIGPRIFNIWGLPAKMRLNTASKNEKVEIAKTAEELFEKILKKTSSAE